MAPIPNPNANNLHNKYFDIKILQRLKPLLYLNRGINRPSMLGFVKSFCGISDFFLKILPFQSKFPLPHALMSCKAIYF